MSRKSRMAAVGLAGGYLAVGLAYIWLSSAWAAQVARDVTELKATETMKGVGFVVVTALLLFGFSTWLFGRVERGAAELARERERLLLNDRRAMAGTLAAGVAHDFRNLITTFSYQIEQLVQPDISDENRREVLASLEHALDTALALATRLTEAARERRATALRTVDLAKLVRETMQLLKGHALVWRCHVELDVAEAPALRSDPVVMSQILCNLVLNAGEAVGVDGRIRVVFRDDADAAVLEVHDNGPGFARKDVFASFSTTRERGSGLGLLSVKSGVDLLGGTVVAGTSPLGGASVVVRLPHLA